MNNLLFKLLTIVALFFAIWLSLSNVDWVTILKVEQTTKTTEEKLGDLFWDDDRQYLWMTLYSRGTTSTDMILVAYEIVVDDTRLEQPMSIPDGWR